MILILLPSFKSFQWVSECLDLNFVLRRLSVRSQKKRLSFEWYRTTTNKSINFLFNQLDYCPKIKVLPKTNSQRKNGFNNDTYDRHKVVINVNLYHIQDENLVLRYSSTVQRHYSVIGLSQRFPITTFSVLQVKPTGVKEKTK